MLPTGKCKLRPTPRSGTTRRQPPVIITKDEDFAQRKVSTAAGPAVVWIRLPNTRRHELLEWFETIMPEILAALERGETLVEVT
jgi:predicted nuclease of predicted toxin-antitoxin system